MTRALTFILLLLLALPGHAAPDRYVLDAARSVVEFTYEFEGAARTGRMPVRSADLLIDLDTLSASQVRVTLNASDARAGFIFATEAMKSASVLNTARYPDITFRSTRFSGDLRGATVAGDLTIRGVTRPVRLKAELFRQRGTPEGTRDRLAVLLTGSVSRAAFGATGHAGQVGDRIGLRIIARITKAP